MKRLLSSWRIWVLIALLVLSVIAINPRLDAEGVAIRQVVKDSAAAHAGLQNPAADLSPTERPRVLEVNGIPVSSVEGFYAITNSLAPNETAIIQTDAQAYQITVPANGSENLGLVVYPAPRSNIRLGLDLSGGTRVVLQPEQEVSSEDLELMIENIKQRLNVFGLSDIVVRDAQDLSGDDFIIVEIAGANKDEVQELLSQQGKFEAKIGNETVFRGGNDVTYVCRSAECSGIDRNVGCGADGAGGYSCRFSFQITLSPEAAQRQADATQDLAVLYNGTTDGYLSEPLRLFLDDEQVDELQISADLKGRAATSILISGSGSGTTQQSAAEDTIKNMRSLQTVLITGSLPVRLEIVKSDGISPALGGEFIRNAVLLGILSILAVTIVVATRYRKPLVSIPIVVTMLSEVVIILGFAAIVGWNMDLAAIAAIIIAIGSGVDDQIVLIDETVRGENESSRRSWKERITSAFFIIFASYFTLAAAMIPLFFAGAGLLRGFAITTIVGVTAGVLVTRPAFAQFIEVLLKKEE